MTRSHTNAQRLTRVTYKCVSVRVPSDSYHELLLHRGCLSAMCSARSFSGDDSYPPPESRAHWFMLDADCNNCEMRFWFLFVRVLHKSKSSESVAVVCVCVLFLLFFVVFVVFVVFVLFFFELFSFSFLLSALLPFFLLFFFV